MRARNSILLAAWAGALGAVSPALTAQAKRVVRFGISMPDFPLTTGQPDRGAGAYQFTAYTIYDPLVAWEMDVSDRPGKLVPGLATEWKVDDKDKTKWRFTLRQGGKFHDGSDFNADAVIWNLDKVLNDKTPQFDKRQSAQVKTRLPSVASYAKINDSTIEIPTKTVDNIPQHVWNYHLSVLPGSPWTDVRLRKALNLAIDRDAVVGLMNGLAKPAKGQVDPSSPWFGKPTFELKYDVAAAKKLVEEAGYSKEKPLKTTFIIAQGGTGQMLSLPMNEFLQQSFKEIGIDVDFKVVELETLYTHWRKGAADEMNAGITANNIAYVTSDPLYAIVRFFASDQVAPVGVNWGGYKNPKVDALINEAKETFDSAKQDELIAQAHSLIVDDAVLVWVVHDTNPHALSPKVKKFVQAQHWFQDLTQIGLE